LENDNDHKALSEGEREPEVNQNDLEEIPCPWCNDQIIKMFLDEHKEFCPKKDS